MGESESGSEESRWLENFESTDNATLDCSVSLMTTIGNLSRNMPVQRSVAFARKEKSRMSHSQNRSCSALANKGR
jgi:hypothetical protein